MDISASISSESLLEIILNKKIEAITLTVDLKIPSITSNIKIPIITTSMDNLKVNTNLKEYWIEGKLGLYKILVSMEDN